MMPSGPVPTIDVEGLLERYDAFFLDAYGVLVDSQRALPGAAAFLRRLVDEGRPHLILSNDASRLPSTITERYRGRGLPVEADRVLTSGELIAPYMAERALVGSACIVLGTDDSRTYVTQAGGRLVGFDDPSARVVAVCDDAGYPFLDAIEETITTLYGRLDRGEPVDLVVPNPDLVYPKGPDAWGLTAGSVALLVESALTVRYGAAGPTFVRLGKPERRMFDDARRRLALPRDAKIVMLGDQLATDIAGAAAAGLDSVLVGTGITPLHTRFEDPRPTWLLPSLV